MVICLQPFFSVWAFDNFTFIQWPRWHVEWEAKMLWRNPPLTSVLFSGVNYLGVESWSHSHAHSHVCQKLLPLHAVFNNQSSMFDLHPAVINETRTEFSLNAFVTEQDFAFWTVAALNAVPLTTVVFVGVWRVAVVRTNLPTGLVYSAVLALQRWNCN